MVTTATNPAQQIIDQSKNPIKVDELTVADPTKATEGAQEATGILAPKTDPTWGNGNLDISNEGVFYTPPAPDKNTTVAGNLEGLLSSKSPYMENARSRAQQEMNSRGLLNTTMAGTAGEKAAIESALPIAQQDAGFAQQQELATQQGAIQKGLYETQGNISERLASAGYQHEAVMKQMDMDWNKIDLDARMAVEYDRMADDVKNKFNDLANLISEDYMNDYIEIMLNPNFREPEDRQRAFDILSENTRQRYEMAGAVSGVELTWPGVPEVAPTKSGSESSGEKTSIEKKREEAAAKKEKNKKESDGPYR